MLRPTRQAPGAGPRVEPTDHGHALGLGGPDQGSVFDNGHISAAITGRPRWLKTSLADLASEHGDAHALASGFADCGRGILELLSGDFALAVVRPEQREVLLAIDRIGIRSLSYLTMPDGLIFASEADTIQRHPASSRGISDAAIFSYLYFHVIPSPESVFSDQHKLQPAEYLHYRGGNVVTGFYWNPQFRDQGGPALESLSKELRSLLEQSVQRHASAGTTGAFLSGGIDSSTVCGMLGVATQRRPRAYSIGFSAKGYDEMDYARAAARHFDAELQEYYVSPKDVVEAIPRIAEAADEPFGNSSVIPAYYCASKAAADGVSTLLAGDGGDELFAGNERYAFQRVFRPYESIPDIRLKRSLERIVLRADPRRSALIRKVQNYIGQANTPLPDRLQSYNFLERTPVEDVFSKDFLAAIDPGYPRRMLREAYARARSDSDLNRMLYLDWKITLADNDLRKVNLACSLGGVDVRYPLLDDELIDFSARVPPGLKLRGGRLRYFFKTAMKDFLPPATIRKSKHGFGLPFGVWLKTEPALQALAYDALSDLRRRPYLRAGFVDELIERHRGGHGAFFGGMIWVMMMLELWLQAHTADVVQSPA